MGKLGNGDDARILHSNPTVLVTIIEIFYENDPTIVDAEVVALPPQGAQGCCGRRLQVQGSVGGQVESSPTSMVVFAADDVCSVCTI